MKEKYPRQSETYSKEVETLAIFVHGALAALHGLGFIYNIRKKGNGLDATVHAAALIYDLHATLKHSRRV